MAYLDSAKLYSELVGLTGSATVGVVPGACLNPTSGGATVRFIKISAPSSANRLGVLFTGGVHAREWTPPDALLSFAKNLIAAGTSGADFTYPIFSQPQAAGAPVEYQSFTVPAALVSEILAKVDLVIAPIINPDGRDFSLSAGGGSPPVPSTGNAWWRKSRNPLGIGSCIVGPYNLDMSRGVDINRNFDVAWKFEKLFNAAGAGKFVTAKDPCSSSPANPETYRGPLAESEAETLNLKSLQQQARHYVDVHMSGRDVLFPWGIGDNQTTDRTKNFLNTLLDGTRGPHNPEFITGSLDARVRDMADFMASAVVSTATSDSRASGSKALQSAYVSMASAAFYPTSGACDDFFFSGQFSLPLPRVAVIDTPPEKMAFTIECGDDSEHGFFAHPATEFPKIEREVHAMLWAFLARLLFPGKALASNWPFT